MVKCTDCGFLAARNLDTRNLDEVEGEFRRSGNPPTQIIAGKEIGYYRHKRYPICFVQEYDLLDSFERIGGEESTRFLVVIGEDRQCELFTEWLQGFTPKEHREMLDRERRDKFESDIRKGDKRWHIAEIILIVLLSGLFTLLGAFISRGG
jgi:hypothetical protein